MPTEDTSISEILKLVKNMECRLNVIEMGMSSIERNTRKNTIINDEHLMAYGDGCCTEY